MVKVRKYKNIKLYEYTSKSSGKTDYTKVYRDGDLIIKKEYHHDHENPDKEPGHTHYKVEDAETGKTLIDRTPEPKKVKVDLSKLGESDD